MLCRNVFSVKFVLKMNCYTHVLWFSLFFCFRFLFSPPFLSTFGSFDVQIYFRNLHNSKKTILHGLLPWYFCDNLHKTNGVMWWLWYYETIFRNGISYSMSHLDCNDILCGEMYAYKFVGPIRINCMRPAISTDELAE